jgi:tetratricopeptide (TPR) repeat protein
MKGSSITDRFNRALEYERSGHIDMAMQEYSTILSDNMAHRDSLVNLGALYSRIEKPAEAMDCFEKALELGEDYLIHFNIGSLHYKSGHYKKAVLALDRSRKFNRGGLLPVLVMGLSFSRLKNYRAADICFTSVLNRWPDNRVALTALAIVSFEKKEYERALHLLDRIIASGTDNSTIRKFRSNVLYHLGRLEESARELKSVKSTRDEFRRFDDYARSLSAEVYTDKYGSIESKIASLEAHASDAADRDVYIALSFCHLLKGDSDKAVDCLYMARKDFLG